MDSVKMIFFDIDGTLLDHKGAEISGIKKFYELNEFTKICDLETFKRVWVKYSDLNFNKFLNNERTFEEQRAMRIIDVYNEFGIPIDYHEALLKFTDYLSAYEDSWRLYDDVIDGLEEFKDYKLGVISNGDYEQQVNKLKKMKIDKYFCDVVTASEVRYAKPNVEIFKVACTRNGIDVKEACYIGDNIKTDVVPANAIGMNGILIERDRNIAINSTIKRIYSIKELMNALM